MDLERAAQLLAHQPGQCHVEPQRGAVGSLAGPRHGGRLGAEDQRLRPVLGSPGKSEKEALELAETVDQERADFIKQYFDIEWHDCHRFHLMVNSGIGEDAAVEAILDAVTQHSKRAG